MAMLVFPSLRTFCSVPFLTLIDRQFGRGLWGGTKTAWCNPNTNKNPQNWVTTRLVHLALQYIFSRRNHNGISWNKVRFQCALLPFHPKTLRGINYPKIPKIKPSTRPFSPPLATLRYCTLSLDIGIAPLSNFRVAPFSTKLSQTSGHTGGRRGDY